VGHVRPALSSASCFGFYRELAAANPAFRPDLAGALSNLGNRYSELGRNTEIDGLWTAALAALPDPADKAFLLLRRAESRPPGDTAAVEDLLKAQDLLAEEAAD